MFLFRGPRAPSSPLGVGRKIEVVLYCTVQLYITMAKDTHPGDHALRNNLPRKSL